METDKWSKKYNVALGQENLGMVVVVTDCHKIILIGVKGMLALYNPDLQTTQKTTIVGTMYSFYIENYEESLVLLNKGELMSPVDLATEESTYDDDDDNDQVLDS